MTLATPALLFPAISLLLLVYTNRFLVLGQIIRQMHGKQPDQLGDDIVTQLRNLRLRMVLIRRMQIVGVLSFISCAISMSFFFFEQGWVGEWVFGFSLLLLIVSLLLSLYETHISCGAIDIELQDIENRR